jgi:hypothetical protein
MLAVIAYLSLTATLATTQNAATAQLAVVSGDAGLTTRADSAAPTGVPRRTLARAGFASGDERSGTGQENSDSATAQRRRAVEHSDWYYRRLTIHKVASYATLPLFATEYYLGDKLYRDKGTSSTKSAHSAVATGIGVLFGVNTVTGVWNLWDSRHESEGRARRITHSVLMLASDAGFAATAALAPEGDEGREFGENSNDRSRHRSVAIGSMGVAAASYVMMLFWK